MKFHEGLTHLRAWQNKPLTLFTRGFDSILDGILDTKILHVGPTGRVVVELPNGSLPQSTSIDLTQAEFEMVEADKVPGDFWILPIDIAGYERFLSATCPHRAKVVFGERELNVYQLIIDSAAKDGISLAAGHLVWTFDGNEMKPSPPPPASEDSTVYLARDNPRTIFAREDAAVSFAEQHSQKIRVFVTGPVNGQFREVTTRIH